MSLSPYKGILGFLQPSPSVKSWGFGEGRHVLVWSLPNLYLLTSGRLLYPHTPFMVKQHLGILFIMLIYTNLGLFAVLADLLRFLLKAHVFACNWFKIVLCIWLYC